MALTDAWLKANSGKSVDAEYEKTDRDGLSIRVSEKGNLAFQIRYRFAGKPRRLKIGTYPKMGLKEARDENIRLRGLLEQGHDPKLVKATERSKKIAEEPFEIAFTKWFEKYRQDEIKRGRDHLASFEIHVFPEIGTLPLTKVSALDWHELLDEVSERAPSMVHRIITNAKIFYKWTTKIGLTSFNPVADFSAARDFKCKRGVVERTMSDEEIAILWKAFRGTRVSMRNQIIYKMLLLTGCRTQEIRLAEHSHFDMKAGIWEIPAEISKNGKKIRRPIIDEIKPILKLALALNPYGGYVFVKNNVDSPPSGPAIRDAVDCFKNYAEKKLGYNWQHWTPHDLRRTARTKLSKYTQPHIAEKILGHELQGMMKVYDQYDYLDEQREALTSLYHDIAQIVGEV